jgi:signal transduction histidine kinase
VIHLVSADLAKRGVALATSLASLPILYGDRVHVQQVLLNLIQNALDAMAELPSALRRLEIQTRLRGGDAEILVSDAGAGIAHKDMDRLFESFYTTKNDGLGLGLSIARSIVHAHGGRIWAETNAGRGATFTVVLPVKRPAVASPTLPTADVEAIS